MSIASLSTRLARIHRQIGYTQQSSNYLLTSEWHAIRSTILQTVVSYPDAEKAIVSAFTRLEQEKLSQWHIIRSILVQALYPFMEARIAIAEALVQQTKEQGH